MKSDVPIKNVMESIIEFTFCYIKNASLSVEERQQCVD
jgi:hypothetical protein